MLRDALAYASAPQHEADKIKRPGTSPAVSFMARLRPFSRDHARSKRSAFITLVQAATKSATNFCLRVAGAIDLGERPQLRVRTEDQIDAGAGPLRFARFAVVAFEHIRVGRSRLPRRAHVEQVDEEVVGQRLRPLGEDTMLGLTVVCTQDAQAADKNRHLRRGQRQQLRLVDQQLLRRHGVFGLLVVAEPVRIRLERAQRSRHRSAPAMRPCGPARREPQCWSRPSSPPARRRRSRRERSGRPATLSCRRTRCR